jgi:transcription elongation factor
MLQGGDKNVMVQVGDKVNVVLGKYNGKVGIVRKVTEKMCYIKLVLDHDSCDVRVYKSSVRKLNEDKVQYCEGGIQAEKDIVEKTSKGDDVDILDKLLSELIVIRVNTNVIVELLKKMAV